MTENSAKNTITTLTASITDAALQLSPATDAKPITDILSNCLNELSKLSSTTIDYGGIQETFGKILKSHRKKSDLTQEKLAEQIGRSRDTIRRYEHGETLCSTELFFQLANILGSDFYDDVTRQLKPFITSSHS